MSHKPYGPYERFIKRPLDCVLSGLALVVLSPVMGVTAYLVKTKLGAPVLFTQERPGKDGKIFKIYKFRSMTDARDENGDLLSDSMRLPPFGKKLRATSLDELPELINIFKGDMAIVGPRPLLTQYLPLYNERQFRRHEIRPGLTGWAQVNGRNSITWGHKFEYDIEYVDHVSFMFDLKIIFLTIKSVLKHEGISSDTSETVEDFDGTN